MTRHQAALAIALGISSLLPISQPRAADVVRVSDGPFVSGGGYYIAREKGYFAQLGLDIKHREFIDGSLSVPGFLSGELDIGGMTASAALFNSIAKGAPLVLILDRGHNKPGYGYTVTMSARNSMTRVSIRQPTLPS